MIAVITSAILILVLTTLSPSALRIALALPLILFLPGYGITALLFPRHALDFPARLLLSVGLSVATTAFSGLILHLTPLGLGLENPWVFLLIGETGLLGLLALFWDALLIDGKTILPRIGFNARQVLFLGLAAVVVATAVRVARTPASPEDLAGYTLLWVQAGDLPDRLAVGVRSEEFEATKYQLRFEIKGLMHTGPTFELRPGQTWEAAIELQGSWLAGQPVTLFLYRLDRPNEVYRRVVWWYEND